MRQDIPKQLQAVEGADIPTFRVIGVVGADFRGGDLAGAVQNFDEGNGVRLILDTPGGDASEAFHFYDYIRTHALKVYVDGYGKVMSAGTIIMAAAGRSRSRLAPNAEYMIHNASGGDEGRRDDANTKMANIYADVTGKSPRTMRAMMKDETFMTAQQAKDAGFVGAIIEHQRLAAQHTDMEKKDKRVVTLTASQRLHAITSGELELDMETLDKETTEQVNALVLEAKEAKDKLTANEGTIAAREQELAAVGEKLTASETARRADASVITALTTERDALKAEVEKLKTTPLADAVKGKGDDTVDPNKKTGDQPRFVKASEEDRQKAIHERLQAMTQSTSK